MTAEILIMNRSTVALAADSAVTINNKNSVKIFNSVNKLFSLNDSASVGIMIYNAASINGIDWEQLIKEYKLSRQGKELDYLTDYMTDFISFIENGGFIPEKQQDQMFKEQIIDLFLETSEHHKELQEKESSGLLDFGDFLNNLIEQLNNNDKNINADKLTTDFAKGKILKLVNEVIELWEKEKSESLDGYNESFVELVVAVLRSKVITNYSGIVIAGFGNKDIFPSMIEINVQFMFNNYLKYHIEQEHSIDFDNSSIIVPFAQSQIVDNFLRGIDPNIKNYMYSFMETMTHEYKEFVKDLTTDDDVKESLDKVMSDLAHEKLNNYLKTLNNYQHEHFVQPIVDSVKLLPKEELAIMAETLVSITSFKRKMIIGDAETVGGPIDVAIISKGDGLIWIKRKHYFDPSLNQAYLNRKGKL